MIDLDGMNTKLREFCRAEMRRSGIPATEYARRVGKNENALHAWLSGTKPSHLISTSLLGILQELGYDVIAWLERRRPASPELRDYLEAPLMLDHIARGLIDPDEIEALRALDQIGFFHKKKPRQIEDWHVKIRRESGRRATDVPK